MGLAYPPADIQLYCLFSLLLFPGPILAGGIGVARGFGWAVFAFFVGVFGQYLRQCLLVTRVGLMPFSAWSKRKTCLRKLDIVHLFSLGLGDS